MLGREGVFQDQALPHALPPCAPPSMNDFQALAHTISALVVDERWGRKSGVFFYLRVNCCCGDVLLAVQRCGRRAGPAAPGRGGRGGHRRLQEEGAATVMFRCASSILAIDVDVSLGRQVRDLAVEAQCQESTAMTTCAEREDGGALRRDVQQWRARLLAEVEEAVLAALGIVLELCFSSDTPAAPVAGESGPSPQQVCAPLSMFCAARLSAASSGPAATPTHKVLKTKGGAVGGGKRRSSVPAQLPVGVLARTLHSVLAAKAPLAAASAASVGGPGATAAGQGAPRTGMIAGLAHVESPLFSLARAGLGLLSQGLGR